jgi:hypothetical protein
MPFVIDLSKLRMTENAYTNASGETECPLIVQQAVLLDPTRPVPKTVFWRAGRRVKTAQLGAIVPGTAIATFTAAGTYPTGSEGSRHAAVYLSHDANGIRVIDQWVSKSTPSARTLPFKGGDRSSNTGDHFYVIETAVTLAIEAAVALDREALRQGDIDAANRSAAYVSYMQSRMAANQALAAIPWWKRMLAQ